MFREHVIKQDFVAVLQRAQHTVLGEIVLDLVQPLDDARRLGERGGARAKDGGRGESNIGMKKMM